MRKNKTSKYYGVCFHKGMNKWRTQLIIKGKVILFGYFINEIDAAKAYDQNVVLYCDTPKLNFPIEPFNPYPDSKLIQLTKGMWAVVDEEDYERVNQYEWSAWLSSGIWYAYGNIGGKAILLHRFIMNITNTKIFIDHKDGNGLNDKKSNLRMCNNSQNCQNRNGVKGCSSEYKGVSWRMRNEKWVAQIHFGGKQRWIGQFDKIKDAASAYNKKAIECYGEFAKLNKDENGNIL